MAETMHFKPYQRPVNYYETDQMGIVHHSNYVRWFEEARTNLLRQAHLDYAELEQMGIFTAILGYSCVNEKPARFGDPFSIQVSPGAFNGVRLSFFYRVYRAEDQVLLATGETRHCFVNREMMPINIKRKYPSVSAALGRIMLPGDSDSDA